MIIGGTHGLSPALFPCFIDGKTIPEKALVVSLFFLFSRPVSALVGNGTEKLILPLSSRLWGISPKLL
jgi:hypothetical protein